MRSTMRNAGGLRAAALVAAAAAALWSSTAWADEDFDLDGDGNADIVLADKKGNLGALFMTGAVVADDIPLGLFLADPKTHELLGTCQLSGEPAFIFRDRRTHAVDLAILDGVTLIAVYMPLGVRDLHWELLCCPTLDGDPTLLWRHRKTGEARLTAILPPFFAVDVSFPILPLFDPNNELQVACCADFDGNGSDDLVVRSGKSGATAIFFLDPAEPGFLLDFGPLPEPASAPFVDLTDRRWEIVCCADLDDDGFPDIVWWNAKEKSIVFWTDLLGTPAEPVQITIAGDFLGCADFNGDGRPDLLVIEDGFLVMRLHNNNGAGIDFTAVPVVDGNGDPVSVKKFDVRAPRRHSKKK